MNWIQADVDCERYITRMGSLDPGFRTLVCSEFLFISVFFFHFFPFLLTIPYIINPILVYRLYSVILFSKTLFALLYHVYNSDKLALHQSMFRFAKGSENKSEIPNTYKSPSYCKLIENSIESLCFIHETLSRNLTQTKQMNAILFSMYYYI